MSVDALSKYFQQNVEKNVSLLEENIKIVQYL